MGKNSLFNNQQNEKATYRMGGNICNPISEKSLVYKTHKNYYNSTAKGKKKRLLTNIHWEGREQITKVKQARFPDLKKPLI